MAVANFFSKAALAASQVLQGVDYEAFAAMLEAQTVGVAFADAAASAAEGRVTLALTINLLARLYPRIALVPQRAAAELLAGELAAQARAINPEINIRTNLDDATVVIGVGETAFGVAVPVIYLGSDGWVARLSPDGPVGSGTTTNPFGAAAAACFGNANVFRLLFGAQLPDGRPDIAFDLSLLDLQFGAAPSGNPTLGPTDLGEAFLVGLGAIGNAAIWALARTPRLTGTLHLIDHETVDLSNLQRYVLATQESVEATKVAVAATAVAGTGLTSRLHEVRWGEFLRQRNEWQLDRVAVAVDSAEDRRAIQAALPRWIANAWTQPGDLGVSRHPSLDPGACLACLYFPEGDGQSEEQVVADALGLPGAAKEVGELLYTGAPVGREFLARVAAARGVPLDLLLAFEGRVLRAFCTQAICGGMILALGSEVGTADARAAVPLAFQSALAGIMLAAELVADAGNLRRVALPTTTRIDLLRPLAERLSMPAAKHSSGRCLCQDPDFIARYCAKYDQVER